MKKTTPMLALLILILLHLTFLLAMFMENINNLIIVIFVFGIFYLIAIAYPKIPYGKVDYYTKDFILIAFVTFGALSAHYINIYLGFGPVISASAIGTLASFIPFVHKKSKLLPAAVYCGSFVGMSASYVANGIPFIILSGIFAGIIFVFSKSLLNGLGGELGTIAFGGVTITSLLVFIFV